MADRKPIWYSSSSTTELKLRGIPREIVEEVLFHPESEMPGPLGAAIRERNVGRARVAVVFREYDEFFHVWHVFQE